MTNIWDRYETDRAYILKLLGYGPFLCDMYAHTSWIDLPHKVKLAVLGQVEVSADASPTEGM